MSQQQDEDRMCVHPENLMAVVYGQRLGPGEEIKQGDLRSDPSGHWVECESSTWGLSWDALWIDQVVVRPGKS